MASEVEQALVISHYYARQLSYFDGVFRVLKHPIFGEQGWNIKPQCFETAHMKLLASDFVFTSPVKDFFLQLPV